MEKCSKKKVKFILLFLFGILFFNFVSAVQPTQQYNKIFLNPFYSNSLTGNVEKNFSIVINPPDKLSSVLSALISFNIWLNPSVNFTLSVNGLPCNNPSYYVSTTYASAGQNIVSFDCSNVIVQTGTYNIILKSNKDTGAITGWLDLTYMNSPNGAVTVHGTEYYPNAPAKLWLQLLSSNGSAVLNGVCYVDIYTPNGSIYLERATMTNMVHDGIYYYNLPAPRPEGVYPAIAKCYYIAGQNPRNFSSFNITSGKVQSGTIVNTQSLDGNYLDVVSDKNGGQTTNNRINMTFNSTDYFNSCSNVSELLMTGLTIGWQGIWNTNNINHNINIYIYNYTSGSWLSFINSILSGNGGSSFLVTSSLSINNISKSLGVNSTAQLEIRMSDTDIGEGAKHFQTDYLYASCDQLSSSVWQEIRGSSEMHVSANVDYLVEPLSMIVSNNVSIAGNNLSYYTGIFISNFTVETISSSEKINSSILYSPFNSLSCNSMQKLFRIEINGTLTEIPFSSNQDTDDGQCNIIFSQTLEPNINYLYTIYARNTWESDIRSSNAGVNSIYPLLSAGCDLWAIANNEIPYPYVTPKNQTYENRSYFYRACDDWYDDFYWFNQTYNSSLNDKSNIMDYNSFLQYEGDYYSLKFSESKLVTLTQLLLNDITATGVYSDVILVDVLNRSNLARNKFFANISTMELNENLLKKLNSTINNQQINYSKISNLTAEEIWNYYNRNLTFTEDKTNYTNIAFSVWGWTGGVSSSLLNLFSGTIWNASNRILTYYADTTNYSKVAEYVWTYQGDRNLTFYQVNNIAPEDIWNYASRNITFTEDVTNYSKVSEYVWLFPDRNLTTSVTNNITAQEIWEYYNRSLTQDIPFQIWSYPDRNLTTDIPFEVWSYQNRSLTYFAINLTEFVDMLNNFDYSDNPINLIPASTQNEYNSNTLNVTLVVPI